MQDRPEPPVLERNQATHQVHRHEVLWQITIPLVVGLVLVLALMVLAVAAPAGTASQLADISLIYLIGPSLIFGLISLLLLAGSIYLIVRLIQQLPFISYRVQNFFWLANARIRDIDDRLVAPFIRMKSSASAARTFRRRVFGKQRPR